MWRTIAFGFGMLLTLAAVAPSLDRANTDSGQSRMYYSPAPVLRGEGISRRPTPVPLTFRPSALSATALLSRDDPPLPEFMVGDECLFCHRFQAGASWLTNRHGLTIRPTGNAREALAELRSRPSLESVASQVEFVLGGKNRVRFLKKGRRYGTLELLGVELVPATGDVPAQLIGADDVAWNANRFGESCAGCHATQTDSRTKSFAAVSLDCYVCHGAATLEHTKDPRLMLLAQARPDSPRVVVSVCGQCHLRGGRSESSNFPFPNNFVPGGELFGDFRVDWSAADDASLNPGDRHIYHNARDAIERNKTGVTCLSCHDVHAQSTAAHRRQPQSDICLQCHFAAGPKSARKPYEVHSATCGY